MESDPAEKYPVVCHAVLGRKGPLNFSIEAAFWNR